MALSFSRSRRRASQSRMYSDLDRSALSVRVGLKGDEKEQPFVFPAGDSKKPMPAIPPAESFEGFGSFS